MTDEIEEPLDDERLVTPEELKKLDALLNKPMFDDEELAELGEDYREDE